MVGALFLLWDLVLGFGALVLVAVAWEALTELAAAVLESPEAPESTRPEAPPPYRTPAQVAVVLTRAEALDALAALDAGSPSRRHARALARLRSALEEATAKGNEP